MTPFKKLFFSLTSNMGIIIKHSYKVLQFKYWKALNILQILLEQALGVENIYKPRLKESCHINAVLILRGSFTPSPFEWLLVGYKRTIWGSMTSKILITSAYIIPLN